MKRFNQNNSQYHSGLSCKYKYRDTEQQLVSHGTQSKRHVMLHDVSNVYLPGAMLRKMISDIKGETRPSFLSFCSK